jgi:LmbE family N-acetylglucosaminyl deacetylase
MVMDDNKVTRTDKHSPEQANPYPRALVVVAHPDDPEFLFGATVAKLVQEGTEVCYLICSDGANGSKDPTVPGEEVSAIRYREQQAAAAALGVSEVIFLGLPDGRISPSFDLRLSIARHIRRIRPELVLTHFPRRALDTPIEASHPDHTAVGEATLCAVCPDATNHRALRGPQGEDLKPHRVKEVWLDGYEGANYFIDATPYVEKKIEAILCHESQMPDPRSGVPPAWVYDRMRWCGSKNNCEYAEEFKRIRI